jgi:hypothetical protein
MSVPSAWPHTEELQRIFEIAGVTVEAYWQDNVCTFRVFEEMGSAMWTSTPEDLPMVRGLVMQYVMKERR